MNFQECQLMEHEILKKVVSSTEEWKKFLSCAAKFYKYSFQNQLLIYGQNPEAEAFADPNEWGRVARRVQEGAKAITLYNHHTKHGTEAVYRVYDASQTILLNGQEDKFELWMVDRSQFMQAANKFKQEYPELFAGYRNVSWEATLLEVVRDKVIHVNQHQLTTENLSAAVYAAQYMCIKRLGVEPGTVMLTQKVIPPRTKQIVKFGNCVTAASASFLRETEKMVKSLAKQQTKEYSTGNKVTALKHERNELYENTRTKAVGTELERSAVGKRPAEAVAISRVLPAGIGRPSERGRGGRSAGRPVQTASGTGGNSEQGTDRYVRNGTEALSKAISAGEVSENEKRNYAATTPGGNEHRGYQSGNGYHPSDGRSAGRDRRIEVTRSTEMGRSGEQHHPFSAGNREKQANLRVNSFESKRSGTGSASQNIVFPPNTTVTIYAPKQEKTSFSVNRKDFISVYSAKIKRAISIQDVRIVASDSQMPPEAGNVITAFTGKENDGTGKVRAYLVGNDNQYVMLPEFFAALPHKPFAEQVDKILAAQDLKGREAVYVCDTPQILTNLGLQQMPMLITRTHINSIVSTDKTNTFHPHGIPVEILKGLPYDIANPAMVLKSISKGHQDDLIVVTERVNQENEPVIVTIRPDGVGYYELEPVSSNFITSEYGKGNFLSADKNGNILSHCYLGRMISKNSCLYIDKKKARHAGWSWLQLPRDSARSDFLNNIITQIEKSVNENAYKNIENLTNNEHTILEQKAEPVPAVDNAEQFHIGQTPVPSAESPYPVGTPVYLDGRLLTITEITEYSVKLLDPALTSSIEHVEDQKRFEQLLKRDSRNQKIVDFLPAGYNQVSDDMKDILLNGLLSNDDKAALAEMLKNNEGNGKIAAQLSEMFPADAQTLQHWKRYSRNRFRLVKFTLELVHRE